MNVYDFDGTIYDGDSTLDFYKYCLRRSPGMLRCLAKQIIGASRYKAKLITKTEFKEIFYCFLNEIDDVDEYVSAFWERNRTKIFEWYKKVHDASDVVVSASPRFLLEPICKELDVKLICSEVDKSNGKYNGINCYGEEKVRRLFEVYGNDVGIGNFYSDSKSDQPLANLAQQAFIVQKKNIKNWD